jgi:hypothetical protein
MLTLGSISSTATIESQEMLPNVSMTKQKQSTN